MKNIPNKTDNVGDVLPAADYNNSKNERQNLITQTGEALSSGSEVQMGQAIADYAAVSQFYTDSGAADAYVLTSIGSRQAPAAYNNGMLIRFRAANANTGASTVNVATLGVKSIKKADGSTDVASGDITTGEDIWLRYDGTNFRISLPQAAPNVFTFDDGDLTAGVLTLNHALGRQYWNVRVVDNSGLAIGNPDSIDFTDANNMDIDFTSFGTLVGTWTVVLS